MDRGKAAPGASKEFPACKHALRHSMRHKNASILFKSPGFMDNQACESGFQFFGPTFTRESPGLNSFSFKVIEIQFPK